MATKTKLGSSPLELRSSVLDAALTLGLRDSMMRRWLDEPDAVEGDGGNGSDSTTMATTPDLTSPGSSRSTTSHSASEESISVTQTATTTAYGSRPNGPGRIPFPSGPQKPDLDMIDERTAALSPLLPPPPTRFRGPASGYDSDGSVGNRSGLRGFDFLSSQKKATTTSSGGKRGGLRWRRAATPADEESDGGYLSEAPDTIRREKEGEKKTKLTKMRRRRPVDLLPTSVPARMEAGTEADTDPSALLAAVNASLALIPGSVTAADRDDLADGYATDGGGMSRRGRRAMTGSKNTAATKGQSRRATSPGSPGREGIGRKKSGFFRGVMAMSRGASKERGRASVERRGGDASGGEEEDEMPPVPPLPPMPLPIADRFARSGATSPLPPMPGSGAETPTPRPSAAERDPSLTVPSPAEANQSLSRTSSNEASPKPSATVPLASLPQLARKVSPLVIPESNASRTQAPSAFKMPETGALPPRASSLDIVRTERERRAADGAIDTMGGLRRSEDTTFLGSTSSLALSPLSPASASPATATAPVTPESARSTKARDLFGRVRTRMKLRNGGSGSKNNVVSADQQTQPDRGIQALKMGKTAALSISAPQPAMEATQPVRSASASEIADRLLDMKAAKNNGSTEIPREAMLSPNENLVPFTPDNYLGNNRGTPSPIPDDLRRRNEKDGYPDTGFRHPFAGDDNGMSPYTPSFSPDATSPNRSGTPDLRVPRRVASGSSINGITSPREQRSSVLAYYAAIPPQMEPPAGPLPAPPSAPASDSSHGSGTGLSPNNQPRFGRPQFLAPMHPYAAASTSSVGLPVSPRSPMRSRSPSPTRGLTLPRASSSLGYTSPRESTIRSSSSLGFAHGGQGVGPGTRRGREAPFPARPVLPPQDRRELVERVERGKALLIAEQQAAAAAALAAENAILNAAQQRTYANEREEYADTGLFYRPESMVEFGTEPAVDRHSSTYIRAARARGEKRVLFASGVDMYSLRSFGGGEGGPLSPGFDEGTENEVWDERAEEEEYDYVDNLNREEWDAEGDEGIGFDAEQELVYQNVDADMRAYAGGRGQIEISVEDLSGMTVQTDEVMSGRPRGREGSWYSDEYGSPIMRMQSGSPVSPSNGAGGGNDLVREGTSLSVPSERRDADMDAASVVSDRHSTAGSSIYSRNSVLDADKSAKIRAGFVKRIAAMYGGGEDEDLDAVPAVPALPPGTGSKNVVGAGVGRGRVGLAATAVERRPPPGVRVNAYNRF